MTFPIFVPTKGRAGRSKLLEENQKDILAFVEAEEVPSYKKAYPNLQICQLAESNRGIGYVRQVILEYARAHGLEWYWMLDDDIANFYEIMNKKAFKCTMAHALEGAFAEFSGDTRVAQAALEYQQYAWSLGGKPKRNSYCDVAVCINVERTSAINYRPHVNGKEDRDFTLQCLAVLGYATHRCTKFAFAAPKNGSNEGGLHEFYADQKEAIASARMIELWGSGVCTSNVKKDGRPDVKINWRAFKTN